MAGIDRNEFKKRRGMIQMKMEERKLDGIMVYRDEYRKENLYAAINNSPNAP